MSVPVTYTLVEWHALATLVSRPGGPKLIESDLPIRIANEVGRAWLARQHDVTLDVTASDATMLDCAIRSILPDTEALAAVTEEERIVREHARRPQL
jgi:hypothetical protein